jgi:hypothetical protein
MNELFISLIIIGIICFIFYTIKSKYRNNNCYSYAFNRMGKYNSKPQPGQFSNMYEINSKKKYICKNFIDKVLSDNKNSRFIGVDEYKKGNVCDTGETTVFLAIDNKNISHDYHFYKKNFNDKYWSHKPGNNFIRNYDSSGVIITDPIIADRDYEKKDINNKNKWDYSVACGYFCNKSK